MISCKNGRVFPDDKKGKKLNKPFRTPGGPKKFSVYVKNEKGNVTLVKRIDILEDPDQINTDEALGVEA